MLIQKICINNFIFNYWGFSELLASLNYHPFIRGYRFIINDNTPPMNIKIQTLLPHYCLTGVFKKVSHQELEDYINFITSWTSDKSGNIIQTTDKKLIQARTFLFLDIIRLTYYPNAIDNIFLYIPEAENDYFKDSTIWGFCFAITLNNNLVIIYGKTWLNWQACIPENDIEKKWREHRNML